MAFSLQRPPVDPERKLPEWTKAWNPEYVAQGSTNVIQYNAFRGTYMGMTAGMNPSEAETQARAVAANAGTSVITMTAGKPDPNTLPYTDIMEFAKKGWEKSQPAPLEYGSSALLKAEIASYLTRTRGNHVKPDEIFVTGGNGPGLQNVMQSYLGPGDIAIVESPLWTFTVNLMKQTGASMVMVGQDAEGILVDDVERQILKAKQEGKRIKMIYLQPINHNPTGVTITKARAEKLLRVAAAHSAVIVSDEPYEMFCYDEQPCYLSAMSGGYGVLTVHTFSKTLGTGLRLGYVHSQPEWLVPLQSLALINCSVFLEYAIGELMASGRYDQILASSSEIYKRKIKTFCTALDKYVGRHLAVKPAQSGGFFIWMELATLPAEEVFMHMLTLGVESRLGSNMHGPGHEETSSAGVKKKCHLGFAFIGPSEEQLVEAARRIGIACERVEKKQPLSKL